MKYISIGAVTKPSTEHIVYVSHCGYDYTLTGEQAALWLDGRYGFDAARNQLQLQTLHQLERMGLVVATEDVLEGEYRALTRVRLVPAKAKKAYSGLSRDEKTALKWIMIGTYGRKRTQSFRPNLQSSHPASSRKAH